jgi:glutamate-1-semialdehyde 2,1-aminomutase
MTTRSPADWNDSAAVERVLRVHRHELTAVIVEPVMANKGLIPPEDVYLQPLRAITRDNDVVLIVGEVITGLRLAPDGAQEYSGIMADLATWAKAIANGATRGAFGGR